MNPRDNQSRRRTGITSTEPPHRPRAESLRSAVAEVTPIPEPFRQRVRGPGYKWKVNLIELHPLICFFGGGALGSILSVPLLWSIRYSVF